jgi:hypothetical protein
MYRNAYRSDGGGGGAAASKGRYMPSFRVNNKTTNSTQAGLYNADLEWTAPRAVRLLRWTYFGNLISAGGALSCEVSVDGGASWTQVASIPAGTLRTGGAPLNPINAAQDAGVQARFISDAGWSSTSTDPQIFLEFEEV